MNTLKLIAAQLREAAQTSPDCPGTGSDCTCEHARFSMSFGTLRVSCPAGKHHVLAIAAKYEKGLRMLPQVRSNRPRVRISMKRAPDADARLAALIAEHGDILEYAEAC